MPVYRTRFAIFLVSFSVIGLELALMRALSLRFWHHFSYMVISVALLGFGASGTAITLMRRRIAKDPRTWVYVLAFAFSASIPLAIVLAQYVPLNVQYIAWGLSREVINVIAIELLMFVPFFFAGAIVGIALMERPEYISGHYAVNLIGSGAGAMMSILLMHALSTSGLFIFMEIVGYLGGVALMRWRRISARMCAVAAGTVIVLVNLLMPAEPAMSQYKMLSLVRNMPDTETIYRTEGPLGRIDVVDGPALHFAPGLSLQYADPLPPHVLLIVDGDQTSAVYDCDDPDEWKFHDHTTAAVAYHIRKRPRVLIVGAGGGADISLALFHKSSKVVALEMNRQVIETMRGPLAGRGGEIYEAPGVKIVNKEARGYFSAAKERFDIIQLPPIDAFGASGAGLYAAQESYLYTVEAFHEMLNGLSDDGILCVTRWVRTPPRDGLRVIDIAIAALHRMNLEPSEHLMVIRNWATVSVIASRRPLTSDETDSVRSFCEDRGFDLCYLPDIAESETNVYHVLDRPYYYEAARALMGPRRREYLSDYVFEIGASTDDKPYFFHFFRWSSLPVLAEQLGGQSPAFVELGYLLLAAAFAQAVIVALILILLPLMPGIRSIIGARSKTVVLGYFLLLGLGFMIIEMCFLQKFILYLAHPIYSAAVVIASFLVFGGLGSMISRYWHGTDKSICTFAAGAVAGISLVYLFVLDRLLGLTQAQPMPARFFIAAGVIAPLALAMGHMFPSGLRQVSKAVSILVPWSWAVNGFASVTATVAAPLLAMNIGFSRLTLLAIAFYALAGVLSRLLPSQP